MLLWQQSRRVCISSDCATLTKKTIIKDTNIHEMVRVESLGHNANN